jgi:hypothetical protein
VREGAAGATSAQRHTGLHRRRGERPLLTAIARVRTEVRLCEVCGGQWHQNLGFPCLQRCVASVRTVSSWIARAAAYVVILIHLLVLNFESASREPRDCMKQYYPS